MHRAHHPVFRRLLLALTAALVLPTAALAATAITVLPVGTTIADNLVQVGQHLTIEGDVLGDLIVFGQTVEVRGRVGGDVLGAASEITIDGPVAGNIRVAGMTVQVNGSVGKNVTVAAESLTVGSDASLGGTLAFAGSSLVLNGRVAQHVDAWITHATVRGHVGGDLRLRTDGSDDARAILLGSQAAVDGNFRYTAQLEATIEQGATVVGATAFTSAAEADRSLMEEVRFVQRLAKFFGLLLMGFVALTFARRSMALASFEMRRRPGRAVLTGALTLICGPLLMLFLLLTLFGAPLALLVAAVLVILWLLGGVVVALSIGHGIVAALARQSPRFASASAMWRFAIGAFAIILVVDVVMGMPWWTSQPSLAWFTSTLRAFLACWGIGAIVLVLRQYRKNEPSS